MDSCQTNNTIRMCLLWELVVIQKWNKHTQYSRSKECPLQHWKIFKHFLKIKVKIRWEGNIINKLAKKQFISLVARLSILKLSSIAFIMSCLITATCGWYILVNQLYVAVKTKEGFTQPITVSNLYPQLLALFLLVTGGYMIAKITIQNAKGMPIFKNVVKKIINYYVFLGVVFLLSLYEMNKAGQLLKWIFVFLVIFLLINRMVSLENEKLKKEIFYSYGESESFSEENWRLKPEWHRYLQLLPSESKRIKTEIQFLAPVGGKWSDKKLENELIIFYRIRYTPFIFRIKQERLFPTKLTVDNHSNEVIR